MLYTLQDYSDIIFTGYDYKLPENINAIITKLVAEIGVVIKNDSHILENNNNVASENLLRMNAFCLINTENNS
jgi:hypothetical protein